ncbi:MAG: hypothetical protein R6W91_00335 [Thermoplasmata archaeon]
MAHALWRGLAVVLLLSSLCSAPAMAATLTVNANLSDYAVNPEAVVFISGTVGSGTATPLKPVGDANVTVEVEGTGIFANTTTVDTGAFSISFEAPSTPGTYIVNVSAEKGADFGYSILSLEVLPPPPDVFVLGDDITFWSEEFVTESKVWVNATVRNTGETDANTTVKIFLGEPFDGKLLSEDRITVPAGGSGGVAVLWLAESGTHLFTVVADHVDPSDRDLTNNQANNTLEIQDILPPVISEPVISPEEPDSLDILTVLVPVEDDLGLAKDDPVVLIYTIGDSDEQEVPMNETKDGFLAEIGPFPGGTYVLLKVRVTDQANNTAETDWYRRDIFYSSMAVRVGNLTGEAGTNISIACSAAYEDGTPVVGQDAILVLDGEHHRSMTDDFGAAMFNITAPSIPGRYDFTVFVNEKRLAANSSARLTVLPATHPDIMIVQGGITFSWANASEVEVTVILCNSGDAPGDVHLDVFQGSPSNGMLLSDSNFTMVPGQFHYHSFSWSPGPGHHAIVALASCPGDIDPGNNIASAEVTIPAQEAADDETGEDDAGGDDEPPAEEEAEAPAWTLGQVILSLGIGLLLSILVIGFITKSMAGRGNQ